MAVAFDLSISVAALGGAQARALQGADDPLGLAGVLGGGPMPAPLSPLQRAVLQAVVALSAGLQLPARNVAGVTPDSVFGAQMRSWLAMLRGPSVDAWAVQLLLNGAAYYNLNGTDMRALSDAVAAVPSAAPAAAAAAAAAAGGSSDSLPVAAVAGGAAAVVCVAAAAALLLLRRRHSAIARASVGLAPSPRAAAGEKERGADLASNPLHSSSARSLDVPSTPGRAHGRVVAVPRRPLAFLAGADDDDGGGIGGGGSMRLASQSSAHISSPLGVLQHPRSAMGPQLVAAGVGRNAVYAERARAMVMQASSRVGYGAEASSAPSREAAPGSAATLYDNSRSNAPPSL